MITPADATQQLPGFQTEIVFAIAHWTNRRLKAAMGFINNILYCAGKQAGAIVRNSKNALKVVANGLHELLTLRSLQVPITYTSEFLRKFWDGCTDSASSIRRIREQFSQFGLFNYEKHAAPRDRKKGQKYDKATYTDLDIHKILLTAEALERIWVERNGFETLPEHKGYTSKLLYDAVFVDRLGMNRKGDSDAGTGYSDPKELEKEVAIQRAQMRLTWISDRNKEIEALKQSLMEFDQVGIDDPDLIDRMIIRIEELERSKERSRNLDDLPY